MAAHKVWQPASMKLSLCSGGVSMFIQRVIDRAFLIGTLFLLDYFLWLYLGAILSGLPGLCDTLQLLTRACLLIYSVASSVKPKRNPTHRRILSKPWRGRHV